MRSSIIRSMMKLATTRETSVEQRIKNRARRKRIQDIVLKSLFGIIVLGVAVAAPNTLQLLRYVRKYTGDAPKLDRRISQAMTRLAEKGLVTKRKDGYFDLTEKGKKLGERLSVSDRLLERPLRWDGKWRIVIFDIWERRRAARNTLRSILERNGFIKIQNSVWVFPYECEEFFAFLRANLALGKGILYIVADEIEKDADLRRHFRLRSA